MQRFIFPSSLTPATRIEPSKDDTASISTSPYHPSDPNVKPVLTPDCVLTCPPGNTKPGDVSFGEPSAIKPTPSSSLFANVTSTSGFANYSQPKSNLFGPRPSHLEAYIIRPTVQTTGSTSLLSYGDEPLRLHEAAMQAQLRNLRPDYSVMDELLNLHPQQLVLMQRRAAHRHGDIVSIQHGRPVNVETITGCMQVKPAIYIISTTTGLPLEGFGLSHPTVFANHTLSAGESLFGGALIDQSAPEPAPAPTSLFQNIATATSDPAPAPATQSIFGNLAPRTNHSISAPAPANASPATGLFGSDSVRGPLMHIYNDFPGGAGSKCHYASPEAYSRHLEEKGEVCTHVEPTESKDDFQHFQTITANKERSGKDESLEEIRLADYKAGRRYGGTGRGLFGGLSGSSGRAFPPPTAVGTSEGKWYPKPLNGDDITFPPYRGRAGVFAGFTVDNSGEAPAFTKSSVWGATIGATAAFKPGPRPGSSNDNPFGNQTQSLLDTHLTSNPYADDNCIAEHQHGLFCRVPSENTVNIGTASASPFEKPPISSTQKNKKQPALDGLNGDPYLRFGPAVGTSDPSDQSKWTMHSQGFCKFEHQHGKLCRVSPEEVAKIQRAPALTFGKPAVSSGFGQFTGSPPEGPFAAIKSPPFAAVPQQNPAFREPSMFPLDAVPSAPTQPDGGGLFGGGLFSGGTCKSTGSLFPSTSGRTLFGGAPAALQQPTQTRPQSQPNHCFRTQPGCALSAQPSNPPARPGGLFGSSNASASIVPSNPFGLSNRPTQPSEAPPRPLCGLFDTSPSASATSSPPAQTVHSSSGSSPFNNANSAASTLPYASSSKPVQATLVAPGTMWSSSGFGASVLSRPNALQDYQRSLREHEERKKEGMRAETIARRGPHDDAALAELIGSAKSAPIDDAISALLSDDKSEKEKEAWYKAGLATLRDSKIIDAIGAAEAASSSKGRKEGVVADTATTSERYDEVGIATSFADVDVAKNAEGASATAQSPPKEERVLPMPTSSRYRAPTISSDNEEDW
jgi:hypothetical protein